MKNIAIIPARSGSKGIKDKNIKDLCGKPLMAYSIEAALRSGQFEEVMVSTDSKHYAELAEKYGADVPFLRSAVTASDIASSWDMVEEVLQCYERMGREFDTFCLMQPTSPLRTSDDISAAYELYHAQNAAAVVSLCELEHPLSWCGVLGENGSLDGFIKREQGKQRQALEKYYRPNGAIYIVSVSEFRKDPFLYRENAYAYIMSKTRSVDIDTEFDFRLAEFLMGQQQTEYSRKVDR